MFMVNLDNISYIEDSKGKKAVILAIEVFEQIRQQLEEMEDIDAYIKIKQESTETLPISVVEMLLTDNQAKIKTMREYRSCSLTKLAKAINISEAYLSQIENKKRTGNIELYKKISKVLDIDMELLVNQLINFI